MVGQPHIAAPQASGEGARPLFSIVMPAFNAQRYLADAVACVQAQTVGDWELIIVDDASTDGTGALADELAQRDARIQVLHHRCNQWVSAARNTGIAAARGHYLWLCDPDDTYGANLLEACLDSLLQNMADVVVFGHVECYFDAAGRHLYDHVIAPQAGVYRTQRELRPHVLELERSTCLGYPWNKVYRLEHLRRSGAAFKRGLFVEDIAFNIEVFQDIGSLNVIPDAPYRYAKRMDANITNQFDPDYFPRHRARILALRDQQESWGMLDDTAKVTLGGLFGRYILSGIERTFDGRAGMTGATRRQWLAAVFEDPLFGELLPFAHAKDDALLEFCLGPLKKRRMAASLALGRAIHIVRGASPRAYSKAKSNR